MRAALETKVFISAAIISQSVPARVLDAWHHNRYDLVLSPQILDEVAEVLRRPKIRARHGWSEEEIAAFLQGLTTFGVITAGELDLPGVSDDPDDDLFFCLRRGRQC